MFAALNSSDRLKLRAFSAPPQTGGGLSVPRRDNWFRRDRMTGKSDPKGTVRRAMPDAK